MNLEFKELTRNQDAKIQFILGITLAVVSGAILWSRTVFGEITLGIAILLGVVGLALIATSKLQKK